MCGGVERDGLRQWLVRVVWRPPFQIVSAGAHAPRLQPRDPAPTCTLPRLKDSGTVEVSPSASRIPLLRRARKWGQRAAMVCWRVLIVQFVHE
jgi:hypothetical protein